MSSITLSSATRNNLLSLQGAAGLLARTQSNLATGKKVNSALDNPVNYFTASALSGMSSDLSSLIDGISNGIQTLQAASKGIESIQKLINLGQSMVGSAARSAAAVQKTAAVTSLGPNYSNDDIVGAQNATAPRTIDPRDPAASTLVDFGLVGVRQANTLDFSSGSPPESDIITIQQGSIIKTYRFRTGGTNSGTEYYSNPSELRDKIAADFNLSSATYSPFGDKKLSFTTSDDTPPMTIASQAVPAKSEAPTPPDTISYVINNGFSKTFQFHKPPNPTTDPANGYFSDRASLAAAINAVKGPSALTAAIDPTTNTVRLTASDKDDKFTLSGKKLGSLGYGSTTYDPSASLDNTEVTYTIGKGVEQKNVTVRYGYETGETRTLKQLNDQLSTADMFAVVDPSPNGKVVVRPIAGRDADTIALSTPSTWAGSITGVEILTGSTSGSFTATAVLSEPGASTRRQIAKEYNALLDQISGLARDSGYNGQNLLLGDKIKLQFNGKNTSSYDVEGSKVDADGLGLQTALDGDFLDEQSVNEAARQLSGASDFLRSKASNFATGYALVGVRQKSTTEMINVLQTGADNLTLADMNQEATSANALNLRQQLAISSLSLSNRAQQSILQLLQL